MTGLGSDPANAAALLAGVLDSAMDAIITMDGQQRITLFNGAAEKIFGWPRDQVLGQSLDKLMPPRFRSGHAQFVDRFGRTGVTSRRMAGLTVVHGLRADGQEFPLDASISQLDTPQGKLYTVILRDVTERVKAQEERTELAAAAHAIREEEKARVARELHDELAQSLTALKMDAIWVRDRAAQAGTPVADKLTGMVAMIDDAVASTRRIAADLRPMLLDDLGLVPAIEWLVGNFTQRSGVAADVDVHEELDLQEPYATAVFRIVQESLVNVAKHAAASQVHVAIERVGDEVTLSVRDNGCGFVVNTPRKPQSLGIMGLKERAHLLSGNVEIQSEPGKGTLVQVRIPLRQEGAAP